MTQTKDSAKSLRPYQFHGMDLDDKGKQAVGECPFCNKEGKFSVNIETGLWRCFSCVAGTDKGGGNIKVFLKLLWEVSKDTTKEKDYDELRKHRRLIGPGTLRTWGCCKSSITSEWLLPGYGPEGKINNLYRYVPNKDNKWLLLATTDQPHGLMYSSWDAKKPKVILNEGPWDGMAVWESLAEKSADTNVVAVAGCGAIGESFKKFLPLFEDKHITMMFDSDHHRIENSKEIKGAGFDASRRASKLFAQAEKSPSTLKWLQWGPDGFDENKPSGWDVRDLLSSAKDRHVALKEVLLKKVVPIPNEWIEGRSLHSSKEGKTEIECIECTSWKALTDSWRQALTWTDGLEKGLAVILASIVSVRSIGDQLWVKLIGPASCGKSTLAEAVAINKRRVIAKSTLKGFHSGWKEGDGSENMSLIIKLANKTLVIKDGDTLLKSPNYDQILSEARDLYDTTSRSSFKNGMSMDHEGVRCTIILCGTGAIRKIDTSELGARFLDCVIMEEIDDDLEDEINQQIFHRAIRNVSLVSESHKQQDCIDPDMLKAMQMTGGYIEYLCNNAEDLMPRPEDITAKQGQLIRHLAKFVAYTRARPSITQDETTEREFSGRLVSVLARLTMCVTAVLGLKKVNADVMRRVKSVAMDTARGRVLNVCRHMYPRGQGGIRQEEVMQLTHEPREKVSALLKFMAKIGITEPFILEIKGSTQVKWRFTEKFNRLYREVMIDPESNGVH